MRKQLLISAAFIAAALVPGPARADYSSTVLNLNPVAYWPLNETTSPGAGITTAPNQGTLGSSFNATFQGNMTFGLPGALVSEANTAEGFDGASAMAATPYGPPVANGPSFTIEAWLLSRNVSSTQCPLSDVDGNSPRSGWLIYMDVANAGQYTFRTYDKTGSAASLSLNIGAAGSISANQWYHLAIVVSNAVTVTNVYAYVNGALAAGPTAVPSFVPNDGLAGSFTIGARADQNFFFDGNIDEVAYYTNALDSATILAHYAAGTNAAPVNAYETLVAASKPILYFRLDQANTLPLAHNLGTFGAGGNGNYQGGTVPGVAGPSFFNLPNGFGANNNACQFSAGGTQSSTSPGPGVAFGAYNRALFDEQGTITLSAWVKVPASAVGWFTGPCGRGDSSYRFGLGTDGLPHFADGGNGDIVGSTPVNDGKWHLWTGVYNASGGTAAFYIDTTSAGTATWTAPGGTSDQEFFIGGAPDYRGRNFSGTVCQVALFTNALSAGQIEQLYYSAAPPLFEQAVAAYNPVGLWPLNETTQPPDPAIATAVNQGTLGTALNGSFSGDTIFGYPGALASTTDSADSFNGFNTRAIIQHSPDVSRQPSFTIEAWILAHDDGTLWGTTCALSDVDATSPRSGWLIYLNINNIGQYTFRTYNQNGGTASLDFNIGAPGSIVDEKWNHVVVVVSNAVTVTNVYGYLNGTLVAGPTALPAYVPNDNVNGDGGFIIGGRSDGDGFDFVGALDEVAFYTNALSSAAILSHYQAGTNPSPVTAYTTLVQQQNPSLYYRMDEVGRLVSPYPVALPVAANLGTLGTAAQGYYQPGTVPGVAGPTNTGFGLSSLACSFSPANVQSTSQSGPGVIIAPYAQALLNLTQAMSLTAWMQVPGGTVSWFETPIGRGDPSYRFDVAPGGFPHFAANPNSDLVGSLTLNDGAWHFWTGVFDPVSSTSSLYIDGLQVAQAPGTPLQDLTCYLLIGGAPDYLNRNFVGNICQVALLTNALSAGQVSGLYNSVGTAPLVFLPTNQFYINEGANGTMVAQVVGTPPLNIQWYFIDNLNNTNLATGQTAATLSITNAQTSQNGNQYFIVANNSYGSVTSSVATLTVAVGPPTIQVDLTPLLQYVPVGQPVTYHVEVTGSTPFHFQWYADGVAVAGNTNYYTFPAAIGSNYYYCTITNSHGPTTSATAAVIGLTTVPPVITFGDGSNWTTNMVGITDAGLTNGVLLLTDGGGGEASSLFYNTPQYIGGFVTFYTYQEANGSAPLADGATFCIQNALAGPAAIGGGGGDLGYFGITPSFAFEMNIYNGANGGIGIQFGTNGLTADTTPALSPYFTTAPVNMASGHPINVRLYYDGRLLHLSLVDATTGAAYTIAEPIGDITGIVQGADAFIGFTGATGGANSIQTVSNFRFSYTTVPLLSAARIGTSVNITWPISVSSFFVLQSAPGPSGPWSNQGGATVVNGHNQFTATGAGPQFYRLILQ